MDGDRLVVWRGEGIVEILGFSFYSFRVGVGSGVELGFFKELLG